MTALALTSLDKVELYTQSLPLARVLAERDFHDPVHKEIYAFLYDIVNEIRDKKIEALSAELVKVKTIPNGVQRMLAQAKLLKRINNLQGA